MSERGKICHLWAVFATGTGTRQGWVLVPPMQKQNGTGTNQSGTGTTHQNKVGNGTGPSGTGTTAPRNLDFLYFNIIKPKFIHR